MTNLKSITCLVDSDICYDSVRWTSVVMVSVLASC